MKKKLILLFILTVAVLLINGCNQTADSSDHGLSIVSTIFPGYDFARQICGEYASVTMLLPSGTESHSFEPSAKDIIKIQNCDLFIYTGGESDTWVENILSSMDNKINTVRMMDCVEVYREELVEGMEHDDRENGEEAEYDEHVWTSPANAIKIIRSITDKLNGVDSDNAEVYNANANAYIEKIEIIDSEFKNMFSEVANKTLIFGDRFPLRYFVEEYGLSYYAAFPGCAGETEPSAATVAFLIDKVRTEKISTVFYIEFSNHKVADSIAEACGVSTAQFNTCHNITKEQMAEGVSYVSLMEENFNMLKGVLK